MQKVIFSILPMLLLTISATLAQDFEGIITITHSESDGFSPVFKVKGDKVLMEAVREEQTVKMISDKETGDIYIFQDGDDQKMVIKQNLNSPLMRQLGSNAHPKKGKKKNPEYKIEVTNEHKTISGYKCTKVIASSEESITEAWIAQDLKFNWVDLFPALQNQVEENEVYSQLQKEDMDGFVMEMKSKELKTETEITMTAEVEAKELEAVIFDIPEDYQVLDMTNISKLIMEAQGDPEKIKQIQDMIKNMNGGGK